MEWFVGECGKRKKQAEKDCGWAVEKRGKGLSGESLWSIIGLCIGLHCIFRKRTVARR